MKLFLIGSLAALVALAACGGPERPKNQYAMPAAQVYKALIAGDMEEFKLRRQCGILIHLRPSGTPNRAVTWTVFSSGMRMFDFTAKLTPVSDSETRVDIEVSKDSKGKEAYSGGIFYARPAMRQPIRPAIEEAIDAILEGRKFSVENVPPAKKDSVCLIQKAGLESGSLRIAADDEPGMNSRDTQRMREEERRRAYGGQNW